ncbi:uncharacterized protein F4822DRAFT_435378 [Hypoxylon trugodes]|uniref:uncharacterized protein n=1 Tax=Hypoxylon trugodes TaxID=326681 RepID=UPI00218E8BA4|nr:uncharacterized protein F4822DRAFT_435378 [Hypoxylon trugodes]KAI1382702.1 hypothetical protein F4822DRAFT_435378 [Hypoxylon trugodes]
MSPLRDEKNNNNNNNKAHDNSSRRRIFDGPSQEQVMPSLLLPPPCVYPYVQSGRDPWNTTMPQPYFVSPVEVSYPRSERSSIDEFKCGRLPDLAPNGDDEVDRGRSRTRGSRACGGRHVQFADLPETDRQRPSGFFRRPSSPYPGKGGPESKTYRISRRLLRLFGIIVEDDDDDYDGQPIHPGLSELIVPEIELLSQVDLDGWMWQTRSYDHRASQEDQTLTRGARTQQDDKTDPDSGSPPNPL